MQIASLLAIDVHTSYRMYTAASQQKGPWAVQLALVSNRGGGGPTFKTAMLWTTVDREIFVVKKFSLVA